MRLKPKTKSIILSLLVHLSVLCMLVVYFHVEKSHKSFKVPGQFKIAHAYFISQKSIDKQLKQQFQHPLNDSYLHATKQLYSKTTPAHQTSTTHQDMSTKLKSSNKKNQQAQSKAISGDALNKLIILIYKSVDKHKNYPEQAHALHQKGKVIIVFTLYPNGKVDKVAIAQSSGFTILDKAALLAVQKSNPIQGTAQYLKTVQNFEVPIEYQ